MCSVVISRPGPANGRGSGRNDAGSNSADGANDLDPRGPGEGEEAIGDQALVEDPEHEQAANSQDDENEKEESESSLISRLFHTYATGRYRGELVFLRYPDLREFAEDVRDTMPRAHKVFLRFEGVLASTFDDTLQLQYDMGVRTTAGLTLKWFQVFVQKALGRLGLRVVALLFALLDSRG